MCSLFSSSSVALSHTFKKSFNHSRILRFLAVKWKGYLGCGVEERGEGTEGSGWEGVREGGGWSGRGGNENMTGGDNRGEARVGDRGRG